MVRVLVRVFTTLQSQRSMVSKDDVSGNELLWYAKILSDFFLTRLLAFDVYLLSTSTILGIKLLK